MNDRDKLIALLEEFGIGFDNKDGDIVLSCGDTKVGGYNHFYTTFDFNIDGKFETVGAWE